MSVRSVIVDSREPTWVQELDFGDAPTTTAVLEAGDLWVAVDDAVLVVERKTPTDLLNTIRGGRLFPQAAKMRERSPWCYLVITGDVLRGKDGKVWVNSKPTGWDYGAVQGALLTVQELRVGVVHCGGDADFSSCVARLANRERGTIPIPPPRPPQILSPGEAMLAALPGIGYEKLHTLLEYTGTPAWALAHLTNTNGDGEKVPGIGSGIRAAVRKAIGLAPNARIVIEEVAEPEEED